MRWRAPLVASLVVVSVACGPTGLEVVVTVPEGVPEVATDAVAEIVEHRLAEVVGNSSQVETTAEGLVIKVPGDTDDSVVDLVIAQGCVSIRPVLDVMTEMPYTATGAVDLIYVLDSFGLVYHTGPAFIEAAHFVDGRASSIEGLGPASTWVVEPTLSERGRRSFVEVTKTMATYPVSSPRRQMVVVLDGQVLSAPQLAPEVDPAEGLVAEVVVLTVAEGPLVEERARALAAYLRYGPLPAPLKRVPTEP